MQECSDAQLTMVLEALLLEMSCLLWNVSVFIMSIYWHNICINRSKKVFLKGLSELFSRKLQYALCGESCAKTLNYVQKIPNYVQIIPNYVQIMQIAQFHYNATKNKFEWFNEKRQELGMLSRQIYKPPLQFSGLCGSMFVSYLLKRFMQCKRDLCGDTMWMGQRGDSTNMGASN